MAAKDAQLDNLRKAVNIQLAKGKKEEEVREALGNIGYGDDIINKVFSESGYTPPEKETVQSSIPLDKSTLKSTGILESQTKKDDLLSEIFRKEIERSGKDSSGKKASSKPISEERISPEPEEIVVAEGRSYKKLLLNVFGLILLGTFLIIVASYFQDKVNLEEILAGEDFYSFVPRDSFLVAKLELRTVVSSEEFPEFLTESLGAGGVDTATLSKGIEKSFGLDINKITYMGLVMTTPETFVLIISGTFDQDDRNKVLATIKKTDSMFKYFGENRHKGIGIHKVDFLSMKLNLAFLKDNIILLGDNDVIINIIDITDGSYENIKSDPGIKNLLNEARGTILEFIIRGGSQSEPYSKELLALPGLDGLDVTPELLAAFYSLNENRVILQFKDEATASSAEENIRESISKAKEDFQGLLMYLSSLPDSGPFLNNYRSYVLTNLNKFNSLTVERNGAYVGVFSGVEFFEELGSFAWSLAHLAPDGGRVWPGYSGFKEIAPSEWECKTEDIEMVLVNRGNDTVKDLLVNGRGCSTNVLGPGEKALCKLQTPSCAEEPLFYEEKLTLEYASSSGGMTVTGWFWGPAEYSAGGPVQPDHNNFWIFDVPVPI
ncbi:MAG: hypothetical protein JXB14_02035 [Candidatus Altiarchaeota archaeon]|nr:hypothetical protein [Candidatus Altiarchaeota archaeon]